MKTYRKGYVAENQLVHILHERGWAVVRAPRSGKISIPSPDVVAVKNWKVLAIEVKSRNFGFQVRKEQMAEMKEWVSRSGGEGYFAIKIPYKGWKLISLEDVEKNGGNVGKKFLDEKSVDLFDVV